ncbi:tRNA-cytidine(32) 2-sulfurtransferase [Pseudolycoriella hygida]|uniref:tRNA-cytidine(32) 2-sulfurtransferase n=1 Tax=Pseudolycoriella hygida TaxID=35572 RepID=A0A9Q0MSG1_9DIPT|nr:tRNA-cytidine(32) 2-sulfurtransferase [Pseudolycoriella hygida]
MSLKKASRTKSLSLSDDFPLRSPPRTSRSSKKIEDTGKILKYIDENVIGKGVAFLGPYGRRKVVYADYSSSGRSLQFLEDYVNKEVLPAYGDTNCTSSVTGLQSNLYYNEAKEIIRTAVNASDEDELIFCESADTSPMEKLTTLLSLRECNEITPILFVSTCEPEKNIRPWLEFGVQIEKVSKTRDGFLDLVDLEQKLASFHDSGRKLMGLFSGSSRLTGIISDDVATTILLHQYSAVSIWDYSSTGPSTKIDLNPSLPGAAKDIVFFSANKFVGGVQAPGILIIKKSLLSDNSQMIYDSVGAIGAVRAGLVVQLKESVGIQTIMSRHEKLCKQMLSHIRTIPEIILLGPLGTTAKRIPTLCFLVRHPRSTYLHHRFVVAVLNDVFGIQATAQNGIVEAMGINNKLMVEYDRLVTDESLNLQSIKPGYTQITLPFFMTESEVAFILEALKMVATEAWKLLPQYEVVPETGEWRHHSNSLAKERKLLGAIRYTDGRMMFNDRRISGPGLFPQNYSDCLQTARNLFSRARKVAQKSATVKVTLRLNDDHAETFRWYVQPSAFNCNILFNKIFCRYMLPGEAHELLLGHSQNVKHEVPFDPNKAFVPTALFYLTHRHNSLSALDVKRFKSRSLPSSPISIPIITRQQSSPSPSRQSPVGERKELNSPPVVKFSLGGEVTTLANLNQMQSSVTTPDGSVSNRNRCHSWSSNAGLSSLSPQIRINLGLTLPQRSQRPQRQRLCSCSSQTEIDEELADSTDLNSPTRSLQQSLQLIGSDNEDLEAYVKEVTTELASEIKSEIRGVISKVEDVLDNNTESSDLSIYNLSSFNNLSSADELRNDSVSASDVAEYLKEFSKGITSQVTSEIREIVNVMNETEHDFQSQRKITHRFSDTSAQVSSTLESTKQRSESFPNPSTQKLTSAPNPESSTPSCPYTGAISKLIDPIGTTSQDSGINLYFHDQDDSRLRTIVEGSPNERMRTLSRQSVISESVDGNEPDSCCLSKSKCKCIKIHQDHAMRVANKYTKNDSTDSDKDDCNKWQYLPNSVWKQTAEAIDEFDMIKDGDKILVCLSGSSSSLCLLHAIRQFSRARGLHIEIGAVTVGTSGVDPRALMLYLRDLDVKFFVDQISPIESLRSKLYTIARQNNYNVLAMGNSLDKLADEFLVSILNKGRVYATQAHCFNRDGDLRVIRPFVYVRERNLEDFSIQKDMPSRPSKLFSKPPDASNSILKVQEVINPAVFENIKNALRPLMSIRIEATRTAYEYLQKAVISRE